MSLLSRALFMHPRDIGLFLRSARTDATLAGLRRTTDAETAFDTVYRAGRDPWASADPRYRYQRRKYEVLAGLLPRGRRFAAALELGAGGGGLSRQLAAHADSVLGIDIAGEAVAQARAAHGHVANLRFEQGNILHLPAAMDASADLVVLADCLYYLPALDARSLAGIARSIARLLRPGGLCMIANHYFFRADPDSRRTRHIHRSFARAPEFRLLSEHRRPFYLVAMLGLPCP